MKTARMAKSRAQLKPKPRREQDFSDLRILMRDTAKMIMRPLNSAWRINRNWIDGSETQAFADKIIKANDRLTSLERIEIYNKQYWFRLIDSLYEDFPGLRAVLGRIKFNELVIAYLQKHPSKSFTLRNLGRKLPPFVDNNRKMLGKHYAIAQDMARFEWAQVVAFDSTAKPVLDLSRLAHLNPGKLMLWMQPYVMLLELHYPLDDFVMQLKQDSSRGDASNAIDEVDAPAGKPKKELTAPKPKKIFLAVHRYNNSLYYKRLTKDEYTLLTAMKKWKTLGKLLANAFETPPDPIWVRTCFETWAGLGWLYGGTYGRYANKKSPEIKTED